MLLMWEWVLLAVVTVPGADAEAMDPLVAADEIVPRFAVEELSQDDEVHDESQEDLTLAMVLHEAVNSGAGQREEEPQKQQQMELAPEFGPKEHQWEQEPRQWLLDMSSGTVYCSWAT